MRPTDQKMIASEKTVSHRSQKEGLQGATCGSTRMGQEAKGGATVQKGRWVDGWGNWVINIKEGRMMR